MTREPVLPAVRAAMFTAVCLGLSMAAHCVMSATAIPPWAIMVGATCVYVPARIGARRERGMVEITLLMGVLQVALHLLFAYAQSVQGAGAATSMSSMPGISMPPMPGMSMPTPGPDGGMRMGGAGMLLGHALAALACAWWLRRGEAAVHAVVRGTALWVTEHLPVAPFTVPVTAFDLLVLRIEPIALALRSQWLRTSRALRGPPMTPSFT